MFTPERSGLPQQIWGWDWNLEIEGRNCPRPKKKGTQCDEDGTKSSFRFAARPLSCLIRFASTPDDAHTVRSVSGSLLPLVAEPGPGPGPHFQFFFLFFSFLCDLSCLFHCLHWTWMWHCGLNGRRDIAFTTFVSSNPKEKKKSRLYISCIP